MESEPGGIDGSKSVRDMHHLRLMSLLQEQVRDHGRRRAAEILGVDRRTLDASLDQGLLTRRIRGALERAVPHPGSLVQVAGPEADVSVNSLGEIAGGVLQDLFCGGENGDNDCVVWLYQGFRP